MTVYQYISTETNPRKLYDGIRERLTKLDERGRYPEDWEIKNIQRAADARYKELTERENEQNAAQFIEAIKTIASKPANLDNLESYLTHHFPEWLKKYANTPETITAEMREFAEMEINA